MRCFLWIGGGGPSQEHLHKLREVFGEDHVAIVSLYGDMSAAKIADNYQKGHIDQGSSFQRYDGLILAGEAPELLSRQLISRGIKLFCTGTQEEERFYVVGLGPDGRLEKQLLVAGEKLSLGKIRVLWINGRKRSQEELDGYSEVLESLLRADVRIDFCNNLLPPDKVTDKISVGSGFSRVVVVDSRRREDLLLYVGCVGFVTVCPKYSDEDGYSFVRPIPDWFHDDVVGISDYEEVCKV